MNSINQMIEQTSVKHWRLLKQLTEPLAHLGIQYFCYQFVSHQGAWFTLGNNPEWLLYSADHQFYRTDPSLIHPSYYPLPRAFIPELHKNEDFRNTLLYHSVHYYNFAYALAIVEPQADGCAYYFFAAPKEHIKTKEIYLNQLPMLRFKYAQYIKDHIKKIYPHCLDHAVNLHHINGDIFYDKDNVLSSPDWDETSFLNAIQNTSHLTKQEHRCLELYKQGLTAKQTAKLLNLSPRTIEEYFVRIKDKYHVNSKRELLARTYENPQGRGKGTF